MSFCQGCSHSNPTSVKFCGEGGARLASEPAMELPGQAPIQQPTPTVASPQRAGRRALALVAAAVVLLAAPAAFALSVDEVITLVKFEIQDAQIIKKIDKDNSVFKLRPPEILQLKKQGVSDKLIRYMLSTASRKAGASGPVATVTPAVEKTNIKTRKQRGGWGRGGSGSKVNGALPRALVHQYIRSKQRLIENCYEKSLMSNPRLQGRITTKFWILPSGRTVKAKTEDSSLNSPTCEACILRTIMRWRFPRADGGGSTMVVYPFRFSSRVAEEAKKAAEKSKQAALKAARRPAALKAARAAGDRLRFHRLDFRDICLSEQAQNNHLKRIQGYLQHCERMDLWTGSISILRSEASSLQRLCNDKVKTHCDALTKQIRKVSAQVNGSKAEKRRAVVYAPELKEDFETTCRGQRGASKTVGMIRKVTKAIARIEREEQARLKKVVARAKVGRKALCGSRKRCGATERICVATRQVRRTVCVCAWYGRGSNQWYENRRYNQCNHGETTRTCYPKVERVCSRYGTRKKYTGAGYRRCFKQCLAHKCNNYPITPGCVGVPVGNLIHIAVWGTKSGRDMAADSKNEFNKAEIKKLIDAEVFNEKVIKLISRILIADEEFKTLKAWEANNFNINSGDKIDRWMDYTASRAGMTN